jgi:drug/metabolite transporter (DMT)-like permease
MEISEKSKARTKGIILVITAALLWGISGTVAQYLFQKRGFSPEWLVVIRMLMSGIVLLAYSYMKGNRNIWKIWKSKHDMRDLALFGIIGMLGMQYTYFASIKYGNAATATILQYLSPVIITCYLSLKSGKLPKIQESSAVALAMLGTFFIITRGDIHSMSVSKLALFWGIASAFTSAFYTLQPRELLRKWGSSTIVGWAMLIGGIAFSAIHRPWDFTGDGSLVSAAAVLFIILFGTLIPFLCYLDSLKYIKPTEASVLCSFEPLSAAFLSVVWLNVSFGFTQWFGTACVILTVIILAYTRNQ